MTTLTLLFVISVLLTAALASAVLWSRHATVVKLAALAGLLCFLPIGYAAYADLLSRPKPVGLEWWHRNADEATVLGQQMREGEGLFLWLQFSADPEPRAYVLPWDQKLAEQLQTAWEEAMKNGTGVRMKLPFEPTLDMREPKFYALPQPQLPSKEPPSEQALRVEPPGEEA
ncbi:hypothetical protein [Geminicoccus roseus]|uniref:hypothetical protein n=1 Tax=Geminicoccus roseus TaxID=404900 RepID=UPI000412DB6C|nr:hypothetical protein [Geminicoccus roseus]